MKHPIGFFDVDCLELGDSGTGLQLRPRMVPLAGPIHRIHAHAAEVGAPVVFTTCCSGRMLRPGDLPDVLFVPLDVADRSWEGEVDARRLFYLEKKTYHDPSRNFLCRAFDMFHDNGNAGRLAATLDVGEWVVFGNAFDVCVNAAATGLLAAGQKVCVLSDITVPSSRAVGESGVDEARPRVLAELARQGARICTIAERLGAIS